MFEDHQDHLQSSLLNLGSFHNLYDQEYILLYRVKDRYPKIGRILLTGYTEMNVSSEEIRRSGANFSDFIYIGKPWNNIELRAIVHKVLESTTENPPEKGENNTETAFRMMDEMEELSNEVRTELKERLDQRSDEVEEEAGTAEEALKLIDKIQEKALKNISKSTGPLQSSIMFIFSSIKEFNRFSVGIKELKNVKIKDMQVAGDKYVIKISYYPKSIGLIA